MNYLMKKNHIHFNFHHFFYYSPMKFTPLKFKFFCRNCIINLFFYFYFLESNNNFNLRNLFYLILILKYFHYE